jgi:tRNA(adenine34) deaminase
MKTAVEEHERWMDMALDLARQAEAHGEVPVGALLVEDGRVLGEGFNQPIGARDPTAHAEIIALRQAASSKNNYRLPGSVLYVTIEPCTMCVGAMLHARVSTLVFGAREPRAGGVVSRQQLLNESYFNHRVEVVEGVKADECAQLLQHFFQTRRGAK